jgi:hypothetical protein
MPFGGGHCHPLGHSHGSHNDGQNNGPASIFDPKHDVMLIAELTQEPHLCGSTCFQYILSKNIDATCNNFNVFTELQFIVKMADVLHAPNQLCHLVRFIGLFATYFETYFVHNVSSLMTESNMDIRTAISHHELEEAFSFNEKDLLLSREQAQIPVICMKCLLRIRR